MYSQRTPRNYSISDFLLSGINSSYSRSTDELPSSLPCSLLLRKTRSARQACVPSVRSSSVGTCPILVKRLSIDQSFRLPNVEADTWRMIPIDCRCPRRHQIGKKKSSRHLHRLDRRIERERETVKDRRRGEQRNRLNRDESRVLPYLVSKSSH